MSYNGYLYCLYCEKNQKNDYFYKELVPSVNSLKQVLPKANVALYTNLETDSELTDCGFVKIIHDSNMDKRLIAKAHGLYKSPFDKTIFLDTDTIIHREEIDQIFDALKEFNFAAVYGDAFNRGELYPDFNTGLIGLNNNQKTKFMLQEWITLFEDTPPLGNNKRLNDQWAFREMFMKHKKDFYVLPNYFMYRWNLIRHYPDYAVLSHDRDAKDGMTRKKTVTKKIIHTYIEKYL